MTQNELQASLASIQGNPLLQQQIKVAASDNQQLFTEIVRRAGLPTPNTDQDPFRLTGVELETMASGAHSPVVTVAIC
jgi:hypothetical protein